MSVLSVSPTPQVAVESYEVDSSDVCRFRINISVGARSWSVDRRYSEFAALHASLKSHSRDLNVKLPPKKLRPSSEFLSKRLSELDEYMKSIVEHYGETLPIKLTDFLHFFKFEPHGLVHQLYQCIKEKPTLQFNTLHLHALQTLLSEPESDLGTHSSILHDLKEKLSKLEEITINGCNSRHLTTSNIKRDSLDFDLGLFPSASKVIIRHCSAKQVRGLDALKGSLRILDFDGSISSIESLFGKSGTDWSKEPPWAALNRLNITSGKSNSQIKCIDDTVAAMPNLENLNLRGNKIENSSNLSHLLRLTILDLSNNGLKEVSDLSVGNISILSLADNGLSKLKPISRLLGLVTLNLSNNKIEDFDEVEYLDRLPMLQEVDLSFNPICSEADYRSQVLGRFPNRIHDLMLDGIIPSNEELAMAKVISALRRANVSKNESSQKLPESARPFNLNSDVVL